MFDRSKRRFSSASRERVIGRSIREFVAEALEGRVLLSAGTFTVSNLNDSGAGSLRQAITDADAAGGTDIIDATGVSGTIDLASALPAISSNITIEGPGSNSLTVNGQGNGSVFVIDAAATAEIENLTMTGGSGTLVGNFGGIYGGGIANSGVLTVTNSIIEGNSANLGGGIGNVGYLTITDSTVSGNSALGVGGGIFNMKTGNCTVADSVISGNSATHPYGLGGGISSNGRLTVTDSIISGNVAARAGNGNGLESSGYLTVVDSTISGNMGDGIYVKSSAFIANSTITGNEGDGIDFTVLTAPEIVNCTISANMGYGVASLGMVYLTDCTVVGNSAFGVAVGRTSYFNGDLIAGNTGGDLAYDDLGYFVYGSNDLIGGMVAPRGDYLENTLMGTVTNPINPMISPLGNYGGPTQTMALLPGSPAIGAGAAFYVTGAQDITATDQRGFPRPLGSGIDIGAYQSELVVDTQTDPATPVPGTVSLREAIAEASLFGGNPVIDFASDVSGTINLTSSLPAITNSITINGSGISQLDIASTSPGSIFTIDSGVTVEIENLTISTNSAQNPLDIMPGGKMDLNDGSLAIDYGGDSSSSADDISPLSSIEAQIASGYNNGAWNGTGIVSSAAAASGGKYAVGYGDGTLDFGTTAALNQVLLKYTLVGDANLDGTVNLTDLLLLLNNYGHSGADWSEGDFNYDGTVNLTDLLMLLNNYGSTTLATGGQSDTGSSAVTPAATVVTYKAQITPFASEPLALNSAGGLFPGAPGANSEDVDREILLADSGAIL